MPKGIYKKPSLEERFWSRVQKTENCWLWTGTKITGYGNIKIKKKNYLAHRISWILHKGKLSDTIQVLHTCDIKNCVNPKHLFLGTQADNMKDMVKKNRSLKGEKNYHAKLTETKVKTIRELYTSKEMTQTEIAKLFGITQGHISYIVNKKGWKDL